MTEFLPTEKGVPIRQPSTANLMIDSADRPSPTLSYANDFQISKSYSIQNGFFTRIGATEVVLEWNQPNLSSVQSADRSFTWDLSGDGATTGTNAGSAVAPIGFWTAAALIDWVAGKLNDLSGSFTPNITWTVSAANGLVQLIPSSAIWVNFTGPIATLLNYNTSIIYNLVTPTDPIRLGIGIDLRPCRYIDFISEQLTYCQNVKDSATNIYNRNVLARWYFAWDDPPQLDKYGLPILMGYTAFTARRIFNPPKQIKWDPIQPVGNLAFQLYDNNGDLLNLTTFSTNWLMTLQLSEV